MRLTKGQEALLEAAQANDLSRVMALLGEGNHPDFIYVDNTPLQEAVRHGNIEMVKALVEAGADVNRKSYHALADYPLDIADTIGDRDIIAYLEDKGARASADIRIHSRQRDFFNAVVDNDAEKVAAMLKSGIDPDFCVEGEVTPLDEAISRGNGQIVRSLVAAGADVNRLSSKGLAPLDIAQAAGDDSITAYLESHGAALGASTSNIFNLNGASQALKPVFREDTLKEIFSPGNWVGKTKEMEDLWQAVPKRLKSQFDFAASFSEARQKTLKQKAKKFALPPPQNPPDSV